jgi:antitoxin MazE
VLDGPDRPDIRCIHGSLTTPMKTRIVKIGNSRVVRLPKPLLEESGLGEEVELTVEGNRIVITPSDHPRSGWDKAFAVMAERGDDALLDPDLPPTEWEETEWTWE